MRAFDKTKQQAMIWVRDMMAEMGTPNSQKALHALRAGLHAIRDRLSVAEVAQLSAQLPLLIRGLYYEGWDPSDKPLRIRHKEEFLALVRAGYAPRQDAAADDILAATFKVLGRHVSTGELTNVVMTLPEELVRVVEGGWQRDERPNPVPDRST